jgi:hypothetical protein
VFWKTVLPVLSRLSSLGVWLHRMGGVLYIGMVDGVIEWPESFANQKG